MVKWDNAYLTGVSLIDAQHKKLFQFINDLEEAVNQGDVSMNLLVNVLDFFEEYAKEHFNYEEGCMLKYKCPAAKVNCSAHQNFIETHKTYRQYIKEGGATPQLIHKLLQWSQEWLREHICKIDLQITPYAPLGGGLTESP